MNVLMLSWEYRPNVVGGLGKAVTELVPALADEGVAVHLVTPRVGGAPEVERLGPAGGGGSTVYRVAPPAADAYDIYTLSQQTNLALTERAREVVESLGGVDLVHVHDWLVAPAGIAVKHLYRMPLLATFHATEFGRQAGSIVTDLSRAIHGLEWRLSYEAWRIICCSQFMTTEVAAAFRTPYDKLDVISNGIDSSPFDRIEAAPGAAAELAAFRAGYAAPDEPIVFCVGRVVYEKGADVLVRAFASVLAEEPRARLIVTGDGPFLPEVRALAQSLRLGDRATFTGFVPIDVRNRLYKVADVAVFPSRYEPFGIVALEAMVAKAPVVAANVGGLGEVVRQGETGVLVYPGNVDALAWGVLHTLQRPESARQRAANAYRLAHEQYTWQAIARRTSAIYQQIVAEREATTW